jgi:hypothetical protein
VSEEPRRSTENSTRVEGERTEPAPERLDASLGLSEGRGLYVRPVSFAPEGSRPTGGGDIPPPEGVSPQEVTSAPNNAPAGDSTSEAPPAETAPN